MTDFIDTNPSIPTYWRSIVLLGRNVASYKFALAKTLIEIPKDDSNILLEDLALPFAKNISEHLKICEKQIKECGWSIFYHNMPVMTLMTSISKTYP